MTVLNEQENNWIAELAGRLRLIQADAVSAAPDQRRDFLQEEVGRALKTVPAHQRKKYLEALLTRFPVAGQVAHVTQSGAPTTPIPVPSPAPAGVESVDETLERFLASTANLPEEKRAEFSRRLSEAGFIWVDRDALVLEISTELQQKLGLPEGQQPHLTRVVELTVFLVDALGQLDRQALKTMEKLSPRSPLLKRSEDLRSAAARVLLNDNESMEPQWREMRGLVGGLFAALQGGGKEFGRQYLERFSPTRIEDVVQGEARFGWMPGQASKKECCWEKYQKLAEDYATPDLIDRRVRDCLAAFAEKSAAGGR